MLGRRCKEDQTKYEFVTLVLDAMAIKKKLQYNPHSVRVCGYGGSIK